MNGAGSSSDEDKHQRKKGVGEEKLVPAPECCIYKVPKKLRKIKEEAYTPQLISIGPFHYKKKELEDMQKQKKRYRCEFGKRISEKKFEKLKIFVKEHEQGIRECYAEESDLDSRDFVKMILDDAIFIIELFLRKYGKYEGDFLLDQLWLTNALKLDLQLLENQLPYFVLRELYMLAFGIPIGETPRSFLYISCHFFGFKTTAGQLNEGKLKHFVDLRRYAMVESRPCPKSQEPSEDPLDREDVPCAVTLNESGVIFKSVGNSKSVDHHLLDIKFQKAKGCMSLFNGYELQIPHITIEDCTECLMRNVMVLEQCHYPFETHVCNYIDLIDSLINTKKDVDLLFENRIISNRVGDHTTISEMFNKLCLEITTSKSCYGDLIRSLREYHDKWWNRTRATLVSVYFRDVWRGTATAAATLLLFLTILQTVQRLWGGWTPPK